MMRLVALAFGCALAAAPAAADPQAVVAALEGAPATLLDLALARLEASVGSDAAAGGYFSYVYFQDGEVTIAAYSHDIAATEGACRGLIDRIRRAGGVDPATGFPDNPASAYASLFSFPAIDQFAVDETYMETVDSMFRITAVLGVAGDGKAAVCSGKLLSSDETVAWE